VEIAADDGESVAFSASDRLKERLP
jgi:hypothetical protein